MATGSQAINPTVPGFWIGSTSWDLPPWLMIPGKACLDPGLIGMPG
jgi:hypothetical protein